MSEGSKMGLFGSKDDNTRTGEKNKDIAKPNETLQERNAPYNIDSDSETYDTESLSIMDINDIIGVQAESAGDSTLESEFAALSEVITDIRSDEGGSAISGDPVPKKIILDRSYGTRRDKNAKDKGLEKNFPKEDILGRAGEYRSSKFASIASINKSLQLIGEAYISEDSQDTDNDESPYSNVPKPEDVTESLPVSRNEGAKVSEEIASKEAIEEKCSMELRNTVTVDNLVETMAQQIADNAKNIEFEKSVDSSDSWATDVVIEQSKEEKKTESMDDVDGAIVQDVADSVPIKKSSCNQPQETKALETIVEEPTTESADVGAEKLPIASSIEAEEPMEVDETNEVVSYAVEIDRTESVVVRGVESKSESLEPIEAIEDEITSKTVSQSDESQKRIDRVESTENDAKTSSETEFCEAFLNNQVSKSEPSDLHTEMVKSPNIAKKELVQSSNSSAGDEIHEEKVEMETDEIQAKEASSDELKVNSPTLELIKSIPIETEQADTTTKDDETKILAEEAEIEEESSSENQEKADESESYSDIMLVERVETLENEPMQVDDNSECHETTSDEEDVNARDISVNNVDIVESGQDITEPLRHCSSYEPDDDASDSRSNSLVNIETSSKIKTAPDITTKEIVEDETVVSSSVSDDSIAIGEPDSNIILEELHKNSEKNQPTFVIELNVNTDDKPVATDVEESVVSETIVELMETEDITLKDSSKDEVPVKAAESPEKSFEVVKTFPDIISRGSNVFSTEETLSEDEKMEVDAGVKREKQEKEKDNILRPDEASQKSEKSPSSTVEEIETMIPSTSDSDNIENAKKIVEETVEIPEESGASECRKIETSKGIDETDTTQQEPKNEENVPKVVIQEVQSSPENFDEIVAAKTPENITPEAMEDEDTGVLSELEEEKNGISSKSSEPANENKSEVEFTQTKDESIDEIVVKKEAASSTPKEIAEALEEVHGLEITETRDDVSQENVQAADDEPQAKSKEDETVVEVTTGTPETLNVTKDTEITETSVTIAEKNGGSDENKTAAMTKKRAKESLVVVDCLDESAVSSEIQMEKSSDAITEEVEDEKDQTERNELTMSEPESTETIQTIRLIETADEAMFEEVSEEKKEIESESMEAEEKSSIPVATTVEVSIVPETEKSHKDAAKIPSITLEEETESCSSSLAPEAFLPESTQTNTLSSAINPDDIEDEEDSIEEEINSNLDPDVAECSQIDSQEFDEKEAHETVESSSEEVFVETEEMEDQLDINSSLNQEDKVEDSPNVRDDPLEKLIVEDSVDESSMNSVADKPEQIDERLEKPTEDNDDDNEDDNDDSKNILSTMVCETEIFHDEQSQNTQEMMDSILETDSSNFNKILDDEEANDLPLEETEIDELADKLPSESEELLDKALNDPMSSQNMDSLEGLLDLDLIQEGDEATLKSVDPIVVKVMNSADEDIETKDVDVSLLLAETDQGESLDRDDYASVDADGSDNVDVLDKVIEEEEAMKGSESNEILSTKADSNEPVDSSIPFQMESTSSIIAETDIDLAIVEPNSVEADQLTSERSKLELAEDLLREIAVDEERKMKLAEKLLLESTLEKDNKIELPDDLLMQTDVRERTKIDLAVDVLVDVAVDPENRIDLVEEVFLNDPVQEVSTMELSEDVTLKRLVRDQILSVAADIEDLQPNSEISELESAVKFLQESEEQDIDSSLVLSPKLVDSVVDEIVQVEDVGMFVTDEDMCDDPTELVAELENIIPDPIAISEAEIISEAAKLESEKKSKLCEEAKLRSPISTRIEVQKKDGESTESISLTQETTIVACSHPETPKTHRGPRLTVTKSIESETFDQVVLLKKSAPIPKMSILEERLKEPPKIEIPLVGEISRIGETPSTPKTSLLIQRDARMIGFQKMLESPKSSDNNEPKIVDTPRKDAEKHEFENVGSPRIILKIAKSALTDCVEPRSPKSPKIRSATNSPNPEDSPGQKLGKIKLKLSKSGHPSIISNENVEEICGQWHTEGTSSLSPLGMKIKFSKIGDASIVQTDKHETTDETKEPPKHKFEEAKRTESPIGMKIKFSRTGDASIVQQDVKDQPSTFKHKDKSESAQNSPKRNESPIGMKIKFSKSGDASIIQPEKSESPEDHREIASRIKDNKPETSQDVTRRTESPLGMKFKLFKTGDVSIVGTEITDDATQESKRTDSPLGMKIKLSKMRGNASIIPLDSNEDIKERPEMPELSRITESPLGMKIKFSKTGDASIIHTEESKDIATKHKERTEVGQDLVSTSEVTQGIKIKPTKSRDVSTSQTEVSGDTENFSMAQKRMESSIGMKFKLSKTGDASIVHTDPQSHVDVPRIKEKIDNQPENSRKSDSAIGMKIKFSKTGDATIVQPQLIKRSEDPLEIHGEHQRSSESSMITKMKLQRGVEAVHGESEKKEKSMRRKDMDLPLEMKIKLSKTGHPTIVACENYGESSQRMREATDSNKSRETTLTKEIPGMKMLKSINSGIHSGRAELTIEPVQLPNRKTDVINESSPKRKDLTISPIETKKVKLEAKLSQMLPEVTIQPIIPREQKQIVFDSKANTISRQQMNVISQEISITQVRSNTAMDLSMTDKLKNILSKTSTTSSNAECEIIEHRPELIIVNENSNSSQDVMIIEELPGLRGPEAKVPKKRGRPRRNPLPIILSQPIVTTDATIPRDPLALDSPPQLISQMADHMGTRMIGQNLPPKENERPKRTCSRQKSYAPPRRGRRRGGGGRGKRKLEMDHTELGKKPRIEQNLDSIEQSTTALITIDESPILPEMSHHAPELYKALRQPPMDHKMANAMARVEAEQAVNDADLLVKKNNRECLMDSRLMSHLDGVISTVKNPTESKITSETEKKICLDGRCSSEEQTSVNQSNQIVTEQTTKTEAMIVDEKIIDNKTVDEIKESKDVVGPQDHQNWLTPTSKRLLDGRNEVNISNVQAMDEETRMSAESSSRSQTPARNMSLQAPETIVNEESQGSVLSTATTESEKVKVKNRRMEISFDPDEGPFSVDKIAEYEWPLDSERKGETFMIQEQISQYLGVKSFKRKYPDLKRRMVDMEERNYLRENGLVSEAMCDMGLTAVCSSEVLDVMCNDFPDQYEEYRKYIRERQMKEHFKKQKELTAAANAEKNRIDLAEMAVQSALSWNVGLNKARRESRKCSLDLQTFTIHVPKKQQKVEEESRQSNYPVALIPGQYTDYYREYTPAELRYYPLNTVLYGPMKPNERKLDSQSEGSQSDSDSDSSSDDSSSSSSDGTQDTEESQSTMDEVDVELSRQKEDIKSIKCKMCLKHLNKLGRSEVLIQCGTCNGYVHPSCIDLTLDMVPHIQAYAWQCTDCKTCAQCHDPADEDKMLFCDMCDRGYHIYCVGLRRVPQGRWHCQECAVCASCGSREAGGANSDRNSVAQWQHEYKKGDKNTRVYVSTLCVPCSKLWRKGRYCPHCSRCHTVPRLDLEANLVHCSACDKYLHLGCVETKDLTIDRKNYLCDFCQPTRQQMTKPLVSKVFRT